MKKLRWGLLGLGYISREFADGIKASQTGELVAVASRDLNKAEKYAAEYEVPLAFGSYEQLLHEKLIDAVYISTPHPMHVEWTIQAAEAGKHILVEKPIGLNVSEALVMIDAARAHDVFLMEAFMYRCHPYITRLREIIQTGTLGQLQLIEASFAYRAAFDPQSRLFAPHLGGGGILDVGCYPVSISRLIAGAAQGQPFADPLDVQGVAQLGQTHIDEAALAIAKFPGDLLAYWRTGVALNTHHDNVVRLTGTLGRLEIPDPWIPSRFNRDPVVLKLKMHDSDEEQLILVEAPMDLYSYEADHVAHHISKRQAPAMNWADTLGNLRTLDRWRAAVGCIYPLETWQQLHTTYAGRPLQRREPSPMKYGALPGLDKPLSRLVLGCDSNNTAHDTAMLLDAYFEQGGNTFDTSAGYGWPAGSCEKNLGEWVRKRGVRDQVVICEKGGQPPFVTPAGLEHEIKVGFDRLGMDKVDVYLIHRDNPQVPIGEWVDLLNRHLRAGRMSIFGLSNFTIPRLQAFEAYAKQHGLTSFSCVSNNLCLAEHHDEIWPGYYAVSSSDAASRAWFTQRQIPVLPWSSQGRGFFTDRAGRDKTNEPELVRCWYSDTNFARRDRAYELARKFNVEPINIALAWVLRQPFPTFPLVGPKRPAEIRSCVSALAIELSDEQVRWLSGE